MTYHHAHSVPRQITVACRAAWAWSSDDCRSPSQFPSQFTPVHPLKPSRVRGSDQRVWTELAERESSALELEIVLGLIAPRGFKSRILRFYQQKRRPPRVEAAGVSRVRLSCSPKSCAMRSSTRQPAPGTPDVSSSPPRRCLLHNDAYIEISTFASASAITAAELTGAPATPRIAFTTGRAAPAPGTRLRAKQRDVVLAAHDLRPVLETIYGSPDCSRRVA